MVLGVRARQRLRHVALSPHVRWLAGPVHTGLVAAELALHHALDRAAEHPLTGIGELADITAVIKTFERPRIFTRCYRSIRRVHPSLHVIVVDDSRVPVSAPGAELLRLPFDRGVSEGRQAGLDAVKTSKVLMMDDDHVFYRQTDLLAAAHVLDTFPEVDLVGGVVVNLPLHHIADYGRFAQLTHERAAKLPIGSAVGGRIVRSKTANFYLARTESLREVGWRPEIKRIEHHDFFRRAYGRLVAVEEPRLRVLHANTPFARRYMAYRNAPKERSR